MENKIKNGAKITILGAGNVGATIAYTLAVTGTCSEIVMVDINKDKADGEAMDMCQGLAFCPSVSIHSADYDAAVDSDIVVVTLGIGRRPGQTRIDLAQTNVNIIKDVMPKVAKIAPDAKYVIVSNPVDVLTYAVLKCTDLSPSQVIGSGTVLDSSRLRFMLAEKLDLSIRNVHAYVFGEHGDSSMIPWSLAEIAGMSIGDYIASAPECAAKIGEQEFESFLHDVRSAGAEVIKRKGATYYAIALSVRKICGTILRNAHEVLTVSSLVTDRYGINDVCLSLPCIVGGAGIERDLTPALLPEEEKKLRESAKAIRDAIDVLSI